MLENAGIPVPEWGTEDADEGKTILFRKDGLFGGAGITLYTPDSETMPEDYDFWTEFIPKVAEYRVHATKEQSLAFVRKEVEDVTQIMWNNHAGARQTRFRNETICPILDAIAVDSINALHMDFGAVDIIMDRYGRLSVLEVNSAPAIVTSETVADQYVMYFRSKHQ
jgi:hypothetical protein